MTQAGRNVKTSIDKFDLTSDTLSSRAGLTLLSRYFYSTGVVQLLMLFFSNLKKNGKGTPLQSIFHQILCYFLDGSDFHLTRFDELKNDPGYVGTIETSQEQMISSHTVKRFFKSISIRRVYLYRKVLKNLFLWRLWKAKPKVIKIGFDTMVMDNNDASQREGVESTYKKVNGFQPLQFYWERYLIDAIFREGSAHSNHGHHVVRAVSDLVRLIRKHYSADLPIIFVADTGFFDQTLFEHCDKLGVGFIVGGKLYKDLQEYLETVPKTDFSVYKNKHSWDYHDFLDKRKSWKQGYRAIYANPRDDDGQLLLEFARPETIIYTNLGMNNHVSSSLLKEGVPGEQEMVATQIIRSYHFRARDELINRAFKDFGSERMPFKSFAANAGFYYMMAISFFLFESFKSDMQSDQIPVTIYASGFRRKILDIAGKLVRSARVITLKITQVICSQLDFGYLWKRTGILQSLPLIRNW